MKKEDLFEAMGDIRPEFIEESEKVHHGAWRRYVVTAASIAAMVAVSLGALHIYRNGGFGVESQKPSVEQPAKNLAKIDSFELHSEGGYYETYTSDDLVNELKYSGDILQEVPKSLYPVYAGYGSYEDIMNGKAGKQLKDKEFDELAKQFAEKAGTTISGHKTTYNETEYESKDARNQIACKTFTCENGMIIEVSAIGDVYVEMKDKAAVPTISNSPDLYQRSMDYYHYYYEKYRSFFDFDQLSYELGAVDPNIKTPNTIVPMSFHDARITGDGNNYYEVTVTPGYDKFGDALTFTRIDRGKCIGKYPIISRKTAQKQLLEGKGITLDKLFDTISEDRIAGVTLTYMGETPQPVYTFYLRLTEKETSEAFEDDEEKPTEQAYIKYYVPAVDKKYYK